jgi:hypothetical protein
LIHAIDDIWQRWLTGSRCAWWPATRTRARAIWIERARVTSSGSDLGAAAFRDALADVGVEPTHFELFDATHSGIEYRYTLAIRHRAERLQP